jgi:hypothetical protein
MTPIWPPIQLPTLYHLPTLFQHQNTNICTMANLDPPQNPVTTTWCDFKLSAKQLHAWCTNFDRQGNQTIFILRTSQGSSGQRWCARPPSPSVLGSGSSGQRWCARPPSPSVLGSKAGLCDLCVYRLGLVQLFMSSLRCVSCTWIGLAKKRQYLYWFWLPR